MKLCLFNPQLLSSTCGCCHLEVAAETCVSTHFTVVTAYITETECEHCLTGWGGGPSFTVWTSVILHNTSNGCVVVVRMMKRQCVWFPPHPVLCLRLATWWPGRASPLWVTQLWGTVLASPLSLVSEPRLMTADDDHPAVLPSSLPHSSLPTFLYLHVKFFYLVTLKMWLQVTHRYSFLM